MMGFLCGTAFCLAVYSIEPKVPHFLGLPGMQEGRSSLSLPVASSACEQGSPGFDGAVLAWSSLRFLILVYGSESVKMCWSGLSFLILRYSNRAALSFMLNKQTNKKP